MNRSLLIRYTMLIAWMAVIFMLSHEPAGVSSARSDAIVAVIANLNVSFLEQVSTFVVRKSAHIVAYFVLGVLAYRAIRGHGFANKKAVRLSIALCALYAISDEIHQIFVPGRSGEIGDVLLDSAAAAVGVIGYYGIRKYTTRESTNV